MMRRWGRARGDGFSSVPAPAAPARASAVPEGGGFHEQNRKWVDGSRAKEHDIRKKIVR